MKKILIMLKTHLKKFSIMVKTCLKKKKIMRKMYNFFHSNIIILYTSPLKETFVIFNINFLNMTEFVSINTACDACGMDEI